MIGLNGVFLEKMMLHLGFSDSFVSIIMSCIKSISYAVLFNGEPVEHIKPTRGLCQGNPLSPYMFLLCAIGLQGLLHKVESDGAIRGVYICRNGPRVSHIFFADDCVLFCHAKKIECQVILNVLATYERGSGQKINKDKTNLFFSTNTSLDVQESIQQLLGMPSIRNFEKYLGLPALVGRGKKQKFLTLRSVCGKSFKGRKKNSCLKPVKRC